MAPKRARVVLRRKQPSVGLQIQRYLRKHAERKFFDSTVSQTTNTTWDVNALSQPIVQGVGGGNRIGDNITYTSLLVKGRYQINPLAAASGTNMRLVIVLDKMNDGIAPIFSDLFVNNGMDSTYSPQQIKEKRFTILHDKVSNVAVGGITTITMNLRIALRQTAAYNATTNVVGANGKNSMWLFSAADDANKPSLNMNFQIEFTDI